MPGERTDQQLWDLAVGGESRAFGELFERHHRAVHTFCFRRTASWDTAEELTSVVFLETWRRRQAVSLELDSMLPWLLGVATRVTRNRRRSTARYQAALGRVPRPPATPDHADDVAGRIDDERRMARVLAAVETLPRRERDVLALCVFAELDYEAAAAALGIPVGTVRSRLSRARSRLRGADRNRPGPSNSGQEQQI